jgi:cell division protein FtsX
MFVSGRPIGFIHSNAPVLTTNFARRPIANVSKPLFIVMSVILATLIMTIAWSISDVLQKRASLPILQARLEKAQRSIDAQPVVQQPANIDKTQWLSVKSRIDSMNQLLGRQGNDINVIFARLADALYKHVTLVSFKYKQHTGKITIIVETGSDKALNLIHQKLEEEPIFQDVLLTRKINDQKTASNVKRFEFKMREVVAP